MDVARIRLGTLHDWIFGQVVLRYRGFARTLGERCELRGRGRIEGLRKDLLEGVDASLIFEVGCLRCAYDATDNSDLRNEIPENLVLVSLRTLVKSFLSALFPEKRVPLIEETGDDIQLG